MSNVYLQDSTLSAIGDAIREKGGTSSLLLPSAMPAAIQALTASGSTSTGVTLSDLNYYGATVTNPSQYYFWSTWNDTIFNMDNIKNGKIVAAFFNTSPSNYIYNFIWSPISSDCYWESDDDSSIRLYGLARMHRTAANGSLTAYWSSNTTYNQYYLDCVVDTGIYYRNASGTQQVICSSTLDSARNGVFIVYIK